MGKKDEALKMALEALEQHGCPWIWHEKPYNEAITAIKEALAEQGCDYCNHPQYAGTKCKNCGREQPAPAMELREQQEPVAVVKALPMGHNQTDMHYAECQHLPVGTLLYTSPPASKPLTDEQKIAEALRRHGLTLVKTAAGYDVLKLGQIAAHGIKGDA